MLIPAAILAATALLFFVVGGLLSKHGHTDGERKAGAFTAMIGLWFGLMAVTLTLAV
ncbi:hypothetical protein [Methylobacterium nigriterrae]|uniref:hypothetical protein n=1 Tax=Methylobacterium nigriterrae TaxID=3127512 RepID=UPI003013FAF1